MSKQPKTPKPKIRSMPHVKAKVRGIPKGGKIKVAKEPEELKNACPKAKAQKLQGGE